MYHYTLSFSTYYFTPSPPPLPLSFQPCVQAAHGSLTADTLIHDIFPMLQSGDLHISVIDLTAGTLYVSFYAEDNSTVYWPNKAYDRQYR